MKKFFPAIFISIFLLTVAVGQIFFNGQTTSASKVSRKQGEFSSLESSFHNSSFSTLNGEKVILSNVDKPFVILNFWASWCRPCLSEFASLNQFVEKFKKQALVIGINNDEENPEKIIKKIKDEYSLKFDSILDTDGSIAQSFNVEKFPKSIVFYKGKVFHIFEKETNFVEKSFISKIQNQLSI